MRENCTLVAQRSDENAAAMLTGPLFLSGRSLAGAWTRTLLFEPQSSSAPSPASADFVLWIQHTCGLFVDMRVSCAGAAAGFAGCGTVDGARFVWSRDVCSKAAATGTEPQRDEGILSWDDDKLVEDAALEGDDYREVWVRGYGGAPQRDGVASAASAVKLARGESRAYYVEAAGESSVWGLCASTRSGVLTVVGEGLTVKHTSDAAIACVADIARALGVAWRREHSSKGGLPAWLSSVFEGTFCVCSENATKCACPP